TAQLPSGRTALLLAVASCAARVGPGAAAIEDRRAPSSNILRADYAGSESCAPCHPAEHAAWQRSPMHNMTRLPSGATLRAPFDGSEFHYKADSVRFSTRGADRLMDVRSPAFRDHLYRVTKVIRR